MEIRCHSLLLGNRRFTGRLQGSGKRPVLYLQELDRVIHPDEYIQNGFRIIDADRRELEGLVAGGYESRRIMMRFYELNPEENN